MKNTFYPTIVGNDLIKLEQFIRGSLLGDGCIPKILAKGKNYRMTFGHGLKQTCYLNWKHQFLNDFDLAGKIVTRTAVSDRYKNGSCTSLHFKSITHPIFTKFRHLYYPEGTKVLNKEDVILLDKQALAIWFMDDGYISTPKNKSSFAVLCTTSFTKEETEFLIELLCIKWNLKCSYYSSEKGIRFSVDSSKELLQLINPYIVDCLKYKEVLYKSGELLELHQINKDNQQPS